MENLAYRIDQNHNNNVFDLALVLPGLFQFISIVDLLHCRYGGKEKLSYCWSKSKGSKLIDPITMSNVTVIPKLNSNDLYANPKTPSDSFVTV